MCKIKDMSINKLKLFLALVLGGAAVYCQAAPRPMEALGRGVVATPQDGGKAFVSWRLLGTDPDGLAFNLYRSAGGGKPVRLNAQPISGPTWFLDENVNSSEEYTYYVCTVLKGKEQKKSQSAPYVLKAGALPYISIPLRTPDGYSANDCSVGDLDGDGEYEIVVHMTGRGIDNAFSGFGSDPVFQAYRMDGTFMWEINLGKNIREGAHYTQFMVYDFDGDGKAELICKTADGTKDALGNVIGDANADWREPETAAPRPTRDRTGSSRDADGNMVAGVAGRILSGPEYLTVFEGATGRAICTVDYVPARGELTSWGDTYGNRSERYLAGVAYLDGIHPSAIMCRGYYARTAITAWDFDGKELKLHWAFDTYLQKEWEKWGGQGAHSLNVADVDGDGFDEIIYGAATIDHDGKGMYTTGLLHGDALHTGDLDPDHPGLEVFMPHETPHPTAGAELHDARTGEILWGVPSRSDNGRGVAFNIDPRYPGSECWSAADNNLYSVKGKEIGRKPRSANFSIYWDGDLLQELLDGNQISKWDWEQQTQNTLFVAEDCQANNGSKSNPALSADLFGDWREELMLRTRDSKELRIFTTVIPTDTRLYTLMHDPQYRLSIAWQNVAYNQPPHTSFYMDPSVKTFPKPDITLVGTSDKKKNKK